MIRFEQVALRYNDKSPDVLSDINLHLKSGSFHFLTGPSGAGKTSLLKLLYLEMKPSRGRITMMGQNIRQASRDELATLRQQIGVVFQDFRLLEHLSAFDNVALPLRIMGEDEETIRKPVNELLDWVGLGAFKHYKPLELSGGQQQRVAIARAVIGRPRLLLADEPTGNLDDEIGHKLMSLFEQLHTMGTTLLIASHNTALMEQFKHPQLVLENGTLLNHWDPHTLQMQETNDNLTYREIMDEEHEKRADEIRKRIDGVF